MNEEEFDSVLQSRSFGTADATRADVRIRRAASLGLKLWGRTSDDLERQLLRAHPELPKAYELDDYRELLRSTETIAAGLVAAAAGDPRFRWLPPQYLAGPPISLGGAQFTPWEARCEIVRRAIAYLESL